MNVNDTHPEYHVWVAMIQRCTNPKAPQWHNYGGRGIKVCERWRQSFWDFYADMGPRPTANRSIDRIDNDGNYEPGNCRWATLKQQAKNRRRKLLVIEGVGRSLKEWSALGGVSIRNIHGRMGRGWEPLVAVFASTQVVGRHARHETAAIRARFKAATS